MSYIGVQPGVGQYRKLDDISGSFNGSTTTFTTSVAGENVTAISPQQLIVSVGGVIQQPVTDYTTSTNSIIFSTAPGSGLDFFAVLMGDAINIGTPSDGSVTTAKLGADLTVDLASGTAAAPSLTFDSNTGLFSSGADEVAISTGGSQRATVDSSGRLLVGTSTSPTGNNGQYAKLVVQGQPADPTGGANISIQKGEAATNITSGEGIGNINWSDSAGNTFAVISCEADANAGAGDYPGRLVFSTTADGASSPTERMRIASTGLVATISSNGADSFYSNSTEGAGTTYNLFRGGHSATSTISSTASIRIYTNGNVQNTNNSYGSLSDIKLKENIVDANSQWDDIKAFKVRNYNLKEGQTHTQIGLVAQEVEPISPGLVYESPDRDDEGNDLGTTTKSVNYSVLYMKAVKALQEAMERIETLEAKVTALETP